MSITITVPNDDHVALRAMAKALEEIAVARGAPSQGKHIGELNYKINIDATQATAALEQLQTDTTSQQIESLATHIITSQKKVGDPVDLGDGNFSQGYRIEVENLPHTDSTGTPWDERIHSASKALNSDGTWRVRRKPADKTPEEWADYIKWVEEDIHLVESLRPEDDVTLEEIEEWENSKQPDYLPEPTVTPQGDDFHVDAGVVTEQEVASIPAPPLPVPPVPPVAPQEDTEQYTFPQVMQFLTERHGRITSPEVDQIIADMGLSSIMDLNTQPEHTGPFIARVKALLGE